MHLRAPSVDQGVHAFGWSVVFFLFMWLGALAVGVSGGLAFVVSLVAAAAIFMFVRLRGGIPPARRNSASGVARFVAQGGDEAICEVCPIACSRRSSAGSFGTLSEAMAETSARIRIEAAGATFVSTAALMERASAHATGFAIPGGSERP